MCEELDQERSTETGQKRDLDEGEEVEREITKKRGKMFVALKEWKTDPRKLKVELRNIHG
jgi:hypothetical protein